MRPHLGNVVVGIVMFLIAVGLGWFVGSVIVDSFHAGSW